MKLQTIIYALCALLFAGCYEYNGITLNSPESSEEHPIVGEWALSGGTDDGYNMVVFKLNGTFYQYYTDEVSETEFGVGTYYHDDSDESIVYIDVTDKTSGERMQYISKYSVSSSNKTLYLWDIEEDEVIDDTLFTANLASRTYYRRK